MKDMRSRRSLLLAPLAAASCSNPGQRIEILPMEIGRWKRKAVENIPGEQIPESVKSMGFKRARRAFYQTEANRLLATVFEMNAQTVAFEMVQKWRPEEGKMAFHQGPYFVTLEGGDAAERRSLADAIEGVLKQ
jgi:hypothetical protein